MNLWHDIPSEPANYPGLIHVVVEIPRRSRNKYEFDHDGGFLRLDRVLFSALHYPGDYGFIPRSFYDDGDPLDVLVLIKEPTFPGCVLTARPIGLFRMMDQDLPDDKVLSVVNADPLYADYHDVSDVPRHFLREVEHFFAHYKDLEGKRVHPIGWEPKSVALERIRHSLELYKAHHSPHRVAEP